MKTLPTTPDFADLLTQLRTERNLSQGQLAKAARLSRTYVYHLEHQLRQAPSPRAARAIARALELHGEERLQFAQAFADLTGQMLEDEVDETAFLDLHQLSALVVENTLFPAHSLDRQWRIMAWNRASTELFEVDDATLGAYDHHLIRLIYDPVYRKRFQPWEALARRLTADFKFATQGLTFLPEYRELIRSLKRMPDYRRLSETSEAYTVPAPSFVFHMKHSRLGNLALRTAISVFSGSPDFSIVAYVPGNQQTLDTFQQCGWQQQPHEVNP
jgi:transcriptional regulator with XRE-family HTH domain